MDFRTPAKLTLVNLSTMEMLRAQFNPEELNIALQPVWNKVTPPGSSHPHRNFSHTEESTFTFDLTFRVTAPSPHFTTLSADRARAEISGSAPAPATTNARARQEVIADVTERFTLEDREYAENFLRALTVPAGGGTIATHAPANVLFVWPAYCTFEAQVDKLSISHKRFNAQGAPTLTVISVTIVDVHDLRFTAQDVMVKGFNNTRRPWRGWGD